MLKMLILDDTGYLSGCIYGVVVICRLDLVHQFPFIAKQVARENQGNKRRKTDISQQPHILSKHGLTCS